MKLLIASNNAHKIAEIKDILGDKFEKLYTLAELNINCDPVEDGKTFLENALIKAREFSKFCDFAVLADDTGLCVHALDNAPGVHSARYAGNHDHAANRQKLLTQLEDKTDRTAHFETVVVLRFPNGQEILGFGRVDGKILTSEVGENGFGYDSIFFCNDLNKPFGTSTNAEKNSVSHRARALKDLISKIEETELKIK